MNVGFVSLGCSKNLIDTEVTIGKFKEHDFNIVNDPKDADIIVINTCGFIESAKTEAINTIFEMAEYKNKRCKYLIVMGCLAQRYYDELVKEIPEVDLFLKIEDYKNLWNKIEELFNLNNENKTECEKWNNVDSNQPSNNVKENKLEENKKINTEKNDKRKTKRNLLPECVIFEENEYLERTISTGENYAYLKIGEGCSNMCTYCAIPYIRGFFKSRPMKEILNEANMLANKGIKELIIIAQDTSKYGEDLYGEKKLAELLHKISEINGIEWIRFLYTYPEGITDELIHEVKSNSKICKYFDIPIQHISNNLLKKMNRKTSKEHIENIISKIRNEISNLTLRTSLIVGFPGETKENFDELYEFVNKIKFDKLGVFEYSKEENTIAEKMPYQIHYKTKRARRNKIMELQQKISKESLSKRIGSIEKVLIENISFDGKYFVGRTSTDVPEEDGLVYIKIDKNNENKNIINKFVDCEIIDVNEYDLIGKII